jgi:hypothetical protein
MNVDRLPSGNETVLVVDDDPTVRRLAAKILERLGHRVLQAQDPDHALRIAMNAYLDLILMDVVLPAGSGLSLAHGPARLRLGDGVGSLHRPFELDALRERTAALLGTGGRSLKAPLR